MDKSFAANISRRQFIRQAACAAVGTSALTAAIRDLRLMSAAVAQTGIQAPDYKALVCIFLSGGNDSNNLIIPTLTSEYNTYATVRPPVLVIPQSPLLPIPALTHAGHAYGLQPCCGDINGRNGLADLFGAGKLAVLF